MASLQLALVMELICLPQQKCTAWKPRLKEENVRPRSVQSPSEAGTVAQWHTAGVHDTTCQSLLPILTRQVCINYALIIY